VSSQVFSFEDSTRSVAFAREILDNYGQRPDLGFTHYPNHTVETFDFSMEPPIKEEIRSLAVKFRGVLLWVF
jgi:hypothetical protein